MKPLNDRILTLALAAVFLVSTYAIFGLGGAWLVFLVFFFIFRFWRTFFFALAFSVGGLIFIAPYNVIEILVKPVLCNAFMHDVSEAVFHCEDANKQFPAAYVTDEGGKPIWSWRVTALTKEYSALAEEYHPERPWNDPVNDNLCKAGLYDLHCPGALHTVFPTGTGYVVVIGPKTIWPGKEPTTRKEITDDPATTILFVEIADEIPHWTEPRDLSLDELCDPQNLAKTTAMFSIHEKFTPGLLYRPTKYANVAFANGSVKLLSADFLVKNLRALATRNGGEKVNLDDDPGLHWRTDPWWLEYVVQAIAAASGVGLIAVTVIKKRRRKDAA